MLKPGAWLVAGAAAMATVGAAHAQQAAPARPVLTQSQAQSAAVPWYERFTTSNGVTETITGVAENDRLPPPAWTLNQRWGVTVSVREAQPIERLPERGRGDQTSVGAYYQFTPNVRLGGEVSVELSERPGAVRSQEEEPRAGVRIESAFRF